MALRAAAVRAVEPAAELRAPPVPATAAVVPGGLAGYRAVAGRAAVALAGGRRAAPAGARRYRGRGADRDRDHRRLGHPAARAVGHAGRRGPAGAPGALRVRPRWRGGGPGSPK